MKKRILMAEDRAKLRAITSEFLEINGYEVEAVSNGREVLDKLEERKGEFDLILSDGKMPVMTGLELLRELEKGSWVKIPVIVYSGNMTEKEKEEIRGLGAKFVSKSETSKLLEAIKELT